jgi:hypothetical protein
LVHIQELKMRSTRAAADSGAREAEGLRRKLSQATLWLQHIKATPLAASSAEWLNHAESMQGCMLSHHKAHKRLGRFPPATEQQLLSFLELLCATLIQVLKQAPALVAKYQQPPAQASSDTAGSRGKQHAPSHSSSGFGHSGSSGICGSNSSMSRAAAEALAAEHMLTGLLREIVPAVITCEVWLQECEGSNASAVINTGGCIAAMLF